LQNREYIFIMQYDCNLVLYKAKHVIWDSKTQNKGENCKAILQSDGNFIIKNEINNVIWATN
ncbi:hypothetical protein SELMODRAFT_29235, partial [Selaginella moellendorffii]